MCSLYELTLKSSEAKGNRISAGHEFEEETARLVYLQEKSEGLKAHPPRMTLQMPTVSGLTYQFDASFSHRDNLFVIECKKRKSLLTGSELVHYFCSKILDYVLASERTDTRLKLRGIFLSTQDTGDHGFIYGMTFGVRTVDPKHPPPEYMMARLPQEEGTLKSSLLNLASQMDADFLRDSRLSPPKVFKEYQFHRSRWEKILASRATP
jgi:hypothetical protein